MSQTAWDVREGDVLERLAEMPDESVHCVVTSPPYWGLRSYLPDSVKMRPDLTDEEQVALVTELQLLGIFPIGGGV